MTARLGSVALVSLCALAGCSTETRVETNTVHASAVEHGRALFEDPAASPSVANEFSCSTCHTAEAASADSRILPGATLAGATERPLFWGGHENDLLRSINDCRFYFMAAQKPWTEKDEDAKAMYAFLESLSGEAKAVDFSVVDSVADLPQGDAKRGASVFERACRTCHGDVHTGADRLAPSAPALPDDTVAEHSSGYTATDRRIVFVEKVRHGGFLGYGGTMPPFSKEALTDDDLAALLAYFDLYE